MKPTHFFYCSYVLDPSEGVVCGEQDCGLYRDAIYVCDHHRWILESEARKVAERHYRWIERERSDAATASITKARRERDRRVYYMGAGPYVKIGIAKHPEGRLAQFRTRKAWVVAPEDVDLDALQLLAVEPGDLALERQRHREYGESHVIGEWFLRTPELDAKIASLTPQGASERAA